MMRRMLTLCRRPKRAKHPSLFNSLPDIREDGPADGTTEGTGDGNGEERNMAAGAAEGRPPVPAVVSQPESSIVPKINCLEIWMYFILFFDFCNVHTWYLWERKKILSL